MSKNKFLVDTSVVPAVIKISTPAHVAAVDVAIAGGMLFSSAYVRMEFIRRWVCDLIKMACIAAQCSTVEEAWLYFQQDFSQRNLKTGYFALGAGWTTLRFAKHPDELSEEFAHLAVGILKKFDKTLGAVIKNSCKCQIGGSELRVDGNALLTDLQEFYAQFTTPVMDCEINGFLKLNDTRSAASKLLADEEATKASAAQNLQHYRDENKWVTCKECAKIGDVVIALEQPPSWELLHGDAKSFPALCRVLGKRETCVPSVQATQHSLPGWDWKLSGGIPPPSDASSK